MFKCEKCLVLQDEIKHLRHGNQKLLDRILLLTDAKYYAVINGNGADNDKESYYGDNQDEFIEYDELGRKVIRKGAQ